MENNRWRVYTTTGDYLGLCDLRLGNDVMIVPDWDSNIALKKYLEENLAVFLHLDNQSTSQACVISVGGSYRGRSLEFHIQIISERDSQYPLPVINKWYHYLPGVAQLAQLFKDM